MIYTVEQIRHIATPIARSYGVKSLSLFGSYARGEATENSDIDLLVDCGNIPWKQIKGMRTWFAHQYWDMSFDKIWVTLTEDVPYLKGKLEKLLSECRR